MRSVFYLSAVLLGLCSIGCSRNYSAKQIQVVTDETSRLVPGALVNREFFTNSGARPYLGRFFVEREFQSDRFAAVVGYGFWRDTFHSRPDVVGSRVQLDGRSTIIVGVAEPDFAPGGAGELWIPKS